VRPTGWRRPTAQGERGERVPKGKPTYPHAEREKRMVLVCRRTCAACRLRGMALGKGDRRQHSGLCHHSVVDATRADRGLPVDMTCESGSDGWMDGLRSFAEATDGRGGLIGESKSVDAGMS